MKYDGLIRKAQSWSEFISWLELLKLTTTEKGHRFARLVQLHLLTKPKFQSDLKYVWLLEEVPKRVRDKLDLPGPDEGIDLITQTRNGKFWAIQAKFRSNPDARLTMGGEGGLSTFTSLAFHTCKYIEYGLVCATTSRPIKKVHLTGDKVGFELLSDFMELDDNGREGWKILKSALGKAPKKPTRHKPKRHQKRAIKNAHKHFAEDKESRGKMIMPCGTGKSLIGFWIAKDLDARRIVVAVPSLALVKQTLNVWTREFLAHGIIPEWICVCSDPGSGEVDQDEFTSYTYDLGVPCTTDIDEIAGFLRKRGSTTRVVFTTYHSGPVLAAAATIAKRSFDLGIMDEAHKTVGLKDKRSAHLLHDENVTIRKCLFMTATERIYLGSSDKVASMDDVDLYGDTFELLTFKEAIEAKDPAICDYKFVTIAISEQEVRELWRDNKYLRVSDDELDDVATRSLAAGLALRKAYTKYKVKRAISFHSSIKKAKIFKRQHEAITNVFPELAKVDCYHVSSRTPTSHRFMVLRDFANSRRSLITNARCLTEGVDIPTVDCVLFADPRRSTIDIVQAAGRAMRMADKKKYGYIIVPLVVPDDVDLEEFAKQTAFNEIVKTVRPLASQDKRVIDYFRAISEGRRPPGGSPIIIDGSIKLPRDIDEKSFVRSIGLRIWEKVAKVSWRPFEEAGNFVRGLGLKNQAEWFEYCRGKLPEKGTKPPDIPTNPHTIYNEWKSYGDWLGTGRRRGRWRPFEEAREFVHGLGLKKQAEWFEYCRGELPEKGTKPDDIPAYPTDVYKDQWTNWGDWLGTGTVATRQRKYRSFEEAREFVRGLGLKNTEEWWKYCKGELPGRAAKPDDIPSNPHSIYKDQWINWGDWLGTGRQKGGWQTFEEAREFVRGLGLKNQAEWFEYCRGKLPEKGTKPPDIPTNPHTIYKDHWTNWGDWLGTGRQKGGWQPFEEAREFVRGLGLTTNMEWREYCRGGYPDKGVKPPDIPSNPDAVYQDQWINWGDWLGTGAVAASKRRYLSFKDARTFVHGLGLKSQAEWRIYCKGELTEKGAKPDDIPATPDSTYEKQGWKSWPDWLGTATKPKKHRGAKAS